MRSRSLTMLLLVMSMMPAVPTLAVETSLTQGQRQKILMEAQTHYDEGAALLRLDPESADARFQESAHRFQLLVDDGVINGALYYDLGNAWFQAGDLGLAIANYLRAQRLIPNDPRLEANLDYARGLVRPQVVKEGSDALIHRLTQWHHGWPVQWRLAIFGIAWIGLWIALLLRFLIRYSGFRWIIATTAAAAIVFGMSSGLSLFGVSSQSAGVLIKDDVVVRKGNAQSYSPQFEEPVNQGLEFRVLEAHPNWLHIELFNGQSGWIPRSDAEIISREMVGPIAIS